MGFGVWPTLALAALALLPIATAKKNLVPTAHIGVDMGSQWLKVAAEQSVKGHRKAMLLKNAQPIVLNAEGARKTPSAIALRDDNILVGMQALSLQSRYPDMCFAHTNQMLGRAGGSADGPPWFAAHGYRYRWEDDRRGAARVSAGPELSVEAEVLSGLLLAQVDDMVAAQLSDSGGQFAATHIALAVPPAWNDAQRNALLDAAGLAALGGGEAEVSRGGVYV